MFRHTISWLNNRSDGWMDDIFSNDPPGTDTVLEYAIANDNCDDTTASRAYWDLRHETNNYNTTIVKYNTTNDRNSGILNQTTGPQRMHGIVGSRCSGASIAIARMAGLEEIPQVSPVSTSARLSNDEEFPYFSRLAAPDSINGQVGALVALLNLFGWERVAILATDTQYAKDIATELRQYTGFTTASAENGVQVDWKGEVTYYNTIHLELGDVSDGAARQVDTESVRQVLHDMPTNDPTVNSRIVVLLAQEEHAFPILKIAHDEGFQKDTIWVGVSWVGRQSPISTEWLSEFPGYLGIAPRRNRDAQAIEYLTRFRAEQVALGQPMWGDDFPHDAVPRFVDSIVALAMAISRVHDPTNGTEVSRTLRDLSWDGVSGPVSFTENGDRADPQYTILNFQLRSGVYEWADVGFTRNSLGSAELTSGIESVCFAQVGCGLDVAPSDRYPEPKDKAPIWVLIVVPFISLLLVVVAIKNRRHQATLDDLQKKLANLDNEVDDANAKRNKLILERGALVDKPDTWCDSDQILVDLGSHCDEYWEVAAKLRETMPDAHISQLWRVQNTALWSYYSFHKHRLALNGINTNELAVWHGTSKVDPNVIYNDTQDGFMMQYSNDGFWGYVSL
jgi:ABC-type branched-subunit amino acid transport system substrate-binding protein